MGRKPRFNLIDVPQYIIQRCHNRESCFFSQDDCFSYLEDGVILHDTRDSLNHELFFGRS